MLVRMRRAWACWRGGEIGTAAREDSAVVLQKPHTRTTMWSSNSTSEWAPQNRKKKQMFKNVIALIVCWVSFLCATRSPGLGIVGSFSGRMVSM